MKSGMEIEAGVSGPRRAAARLNESNPPASAHLNLPKTAFARLGLPSPTSIFSVTEKDE
jgi:hypothetical protein